MARPTDYNDSMIQKANEYIDSCGRQATELPTVEGCAKALGVSRDTIYEWIKPIHKYTEFSDTIKRIEEEQKNQLVNDGLYGGKEVNQAMAIFLLKANHGMIETNRTELGGATNGNTEPIRLFVNAGQGFLPTSVTLSSSPITSTPTEPTEIQSVDMAQESKKDIHSDNGSSKAGTS